MKTESCKVLNKIGSAHFAQDCKQCRLHHSMISYIKTVTSTNLRLNCGKFSVFTATILEINTIVDGDLGSHCRKSKMQYISRSISCKALKAKGSQGTQTKCNIETSLTSYLV